MYRYFFIVSFAILFSFCGKTGPSEISQPHPVVTAEDTFVHTFAFPKADLDHRNNIQNLLDQKYTLVPIMTQGKKSIVFHGSYQAFEGIIEGKDYFLVKVTVPLTKDGLRELSDQKVTPEFLFYDPHTQLVMIKHTLPEIEIANLRTWAKETSR